MKKSMIFIIGLSCLSTALMAKEKPGYPTFEGNYIRLHSNYYLCGGFTITQLRDKSVRVMSRKFTKGLAALVGLGGKDFQPGKILSKNPDKNAPYEDKNWVTLLGGLRAKYNWAGLNKEYRIFCQKRDPFGTWLDAPCREVVTISKEEIRHRKLCSGILAKLGGGVGVETYYAPLNLK